MCDTSAKQAVKISHFSPLSLIYQPPSGYLLCRSQALLLAKFAEHSSPLWLARWRGPEVLPRQGSQITASLGNVLSTFLLPCTKAARHWLPAHTELHAHGSPLLPPHKLSPARQKAGTRLGAVNGQEFISLMEAAMANSTALMKWWVTRQHFKGL